MSNGSRLFAEKIGLHGAWTRRYRDLCNDFMADAGGAEHLSQLKISLCRRAASLTVECERLECALAEGKQIDTDLLARLSSHLRRIGETIGLDRKARDATPSIEEIARQHRAAE